MTVSFTTTYLTQYNSMKSDYRIENLEKLQEQQANLNRKQRSGIARAQNPRPTTLDSERVFSAAQPLRLYINLPHLTVVIQVTSEELH